MAFLKDGDVRAQEEMLKEQSNNLVNATASKKIFELIWSSWWHFTRLVDAGIAERIHGRVSSIVYIFFGLLFAYIYESLIF